MMKENPVSLIIRHLLLLILLIVFIDSIRVWGVDRGIRATHQLPWENNADPATLAIPHSLFTLGLNSKNWDFISNWTLIYWGIIANIRVIQWFQWWVSGDPAPTATSNFYYYRRNLGFLGGDRDLFLVGRDLFMARSRPMRGPIRVQPLTAAGRDLLFIRSRSVGNRSRSNCG